MPSHIKQHVIKKLLADYILVLVYVERHDIGSIENGEDHEDNVEIDQCHAVRPGGRQKVWGMGGGVNWCTAVPTPRQEGAHVLHILRSRCSSFNTKIA